MSVYTSVTQDELGLWLKQYSLGTLIALQGIASGIENTNYFVTTTHGKFVLTLFEKLTAVELPYFLNLMAHLSRHGIPCPNPVANHDNVFLSELQGKPACIVSCLKGRSVEAPSLEQCAEVGEVLADIHLAGETFPPSMENPRGPRWWKATAPEVLPYLPEDQVVLLKEELRYQSLYRFRDLPRGIIHADLFRDNALFDGNRLSGVIDFYYACTDVWLYDVAIVANDWCIEPDGHLDSEHTLALLRAYHRGRPLTAIERGAWPVMLRAAALRFWLSRLHDYYFPREGELTHAKDPAHIQRTLQRHIAAEADLQRLWV